MPLKIPKNNNSIVNNGESTPEFNSPDANMVPGRTLSIENLEINQIVFSKKYGNYSPTQKQKISSHSPLVSDDADSERDFPFGSNVQILEADSPIGKIMF